MFDFFFFFKQKTAYEIKECDWSSDVCSSDLHRTLGMRSTNNGHVGVLFGKLQTGTGEGDRDSGDIQDAPTCEQTHIQGGLVVSTAGGVNLFPQIEIGRASCRERV